MILNTDVLIVGGGFAGFSCFRNIDRKRKRVTLLTNRDHFLFTPLLPHAAVGSVEVRSIIESIHLFEKKPGEVITGEVFDIKPQEKKLLVKFSDEQIRELRYQTLVIATGAIPATFDVPGVLDYCLFIKEAKDARKVREKILTQFDKASALDPSERKRALNFVIIGAGATGIETACEIHDLVKDDLLRFYPQLAADIQIQIIEAAHDILPAFDRTLARYASLKLTQKGIVVRTGLSVKEVKDGAVILATGEIIQSETMIWATGNAPNLFTKIFAERVGCNLEKGGRIPIDKNLKVRNGLHEIYAIGDCSAYKDEKDTLLPATAQVAMKQGIYLGRYLSDKEKKPFNFKSMGMLVSLGSRSAIADLGTLHFKGALAWWFWRAAYLTRLVSLRNKVSVAFDWFKVKIFGRNIARIDF